MLIWNTSKDRAILKHQPYIDTLPSELSTPLFWTDHEVNLLEGTNLYGAIQDRRTAWQDSWRRARLWVHSVRSEWAQGFSW